MDAAQEAAGANLDFDSAWDNFMKEQEYMLENCHENLLNNEESHAFSKYLDSLMNEQTKPKEVIRKLDEELHRLNANEMMHPALSANQEPETNHIHDTGRPFIHPNEPPKHSEAGSVHHINDFAPVNSLNGHDSLNTAQHSSIQPRPVPIQPKQTLNEQKTSQQGHGLHQSQQSQQSHVNPAPQTTSIPPSQATTQNDLQSRHTSREGHPLNANGSSERPKSPVEYLSQTETMIKMQMDNFQAAYPYIPDPQAYYPPPSYYPTHLSMFKVQQLPSLQMNYQHLFQQVLPVQTAVPEYTDQPKQDQGGQSYGENANNEPRGTKRSMTEEISRINHVNSEKKRRAHIKNKYGELCDLIPVVRLSKAKFAKSHVLQAAVDRLIELAAENKRIRASIEQKGISTSNIVKVGLDHMDQGSHLLTPDNSASSSACSASD